MYALEKVMKSANIEKLLNHYGFNISHQEGTIARSCCKIHGGNNDTSFAINMDDGLWYCHTGGCGGGDIFTLVEKMEGYEGKTAFHDAIKFLASFFDVDINNMELAERQSRTKKELNEFIRVTKKRRKSDIEEYVLDDEVKQVAKFRNFKEDTLIHFGLGFVDSIKLKKTNGDSYVLRNRLLFPIILNGIQVGVSLRRTKSTDYPKWSHQPLNIKTRDLLYNYDGAKSAKEIIVVEGMADVWAYYEIEKVAVATFGAHVTDKQYKLLLKTGADLVFSFDGDEAGEIATSKAVEMFRNKANMTKVQFDVGEDPASITREELLDKYGKREKRS